MAYTPHVLVAISGSWTTDPAEVWENTIRLRADGGGGVTLDPEAYLNDIKTPLATWFAAAGTNMQPRALLQTVKCNHIGADGKYVDVGATHRHDYSPAVSGGATISAQNAFPGKVCLVYTWETALKRGRAHRGRIYPPNTYDSSQSPFHTDNGIALANATNGAGLLAVLRNVAGADGTKGTPVVASRIAGDIVDITGCSSDTIFDVQRRRGDRVVGSRSIIVGFA